MVSQYFHGNLLCIPLTMTNNIRIICTLTNDLPFRAPPHSAPNKQNKFVRNTDQFEEACTRDGRSVPVAARAYVAT